MAKVQTIPRNGLVGEWKLDGNANDTSGNGNNGTATNVTWSSTDRGYQSQCAVFNGSSSKITASSFPSITNAFTVSIWIKSDNLSKTNSYIYEKGHIGATNQHAILYGYVANTYEFFSTVYRGGSIAISDTSWHHIAYTYDGATFKAYKDNVLVSSATVTFTLSYTAGQFSYGGSALGDYSQQTSQCPRFFNRALSVQEIQSLYMEGMRKLGGAGLAPLTDGLVAYYDFNGDANDIIGGNNGTVTGATLTTDRFGNNNRAYSFNGSGQYITVSCGSGYNNFTIVGWFNTSNLAVLDSTSRSIIGSNSWSAGKFLLQLMARSAFGNSNTWLVPQEYQMTGGSVSTTVGSTPIQTGVDYQYTMTFDNTSHVAKTYINGVLHLTSSSNMSNSLDLNGLQLGSSFQNAYFTGKQDGMLFINRILSDSEILALYKLSSTRYLTPLLH